MQRLVLLGLLLLPIAARAATVNLGAHGVLNLDVPKGWSLSSDKEQDSGVAITFTPPDGVNARCILTVAFVDPDEPVTREKMQEQVLNLGDEFVDMSVDKKKVLRDLKVKGGYGCYCVFTDASMVGKPSTRDLYKMVGVGEFRLAEDLTAAFSIAADDEKGPDFQALLASVTSATVTHQK